MSHSNEKARSNLSKKFDQKLNEDIIAKQKELIDEQRQQIKKISEGVEKQKILIDLMGTKIDALTERKIQADELISLYEQQRTLLEERIDDHLPENFTRSNEPIITDRICCICLENIVPLSRDVVFLNCGHGMHFSCLRQCAKKECPICKIAY